MQIGEVRRVADAILARIMSGAYPAGLRIPAESELAAEFGCGRSTVRESLRHLTGMGVVRSRKGSGAVVLDFRTQGRSMALLGPWLASGKTDLSLGALAAELLTMRTHLAGTGARLAAQHAPAGALSVARDLVDVSRTLEDDPAAHAVNDLALHRAIAAASGIWPAVWLSNSLQEPLIELSRQFPPLALVPDGYADCMSTLLDLIEARDAEGAVACLTAHLEGIDALVLEKLAPLSGLIGDSIAVADSTAADPGATP